jgi:hypothetical protein
MSQDGYIIGASAGDDDFSFLHEVSQAIMPQNQQPSNLTGRQAPR